MFHVISLIKELHVRNLGQSSKKLPLNELSVRWQPLICQRIEFTNQMPTSEYRMTSIQAGQNPFISLYDKHLHSTST